ncbi:hypothetical protein Pan44_26870 [Caulifigura coniformis]|uniref:Thioredoxin domain-containing protein n=1 Tax=Caulifigura coniformis TaxID=2527983 RepID=A0A517SET2_9PLAN|nr:hypothetical protein [Caulifigura coniformis]QDT54652.1 hypothetical protein Pan44_26870 [Caulifigura coniformis]
MKIRLLIIVAVVACVLCSAPALASQALRPKAQALVAVSWAAVEARRNAEPDLPSSGNWTAPADPTADRDPGKVKAVSAAAASIAVLMQEPLRSRTHLAVLPQLDIPAPPPQVVERPAPQPLPPANFQVHTPVPITDQVARGVCVRMISGDWCKWCNHDEICAAAELDGMQDLVIVEMVGKDGPWPYGTERCPTFLFMVDGKIVDRLTGKTQWPAIREKLAALLKNDPKAVSAIGVGSVRARPQILQLIDTMRPILGNGGSLTFVYKRSGSTPTEIPLGEIPIRVFANTSVTWSFKGENLVVAINPPVQARVAGWINVAGVTITPERLTLDLPWLPDVALAVTE